MHQHQRHVNRGWCLNPKVLGATFDAFDSLDSDPRPNLMSQNESNAFKVGPKARTSDALDPLAASEPEARASGVVSESKVLGATLDALDSFDSDPGPNLMSQMNLMNLKSAPRPGLEMHSIH